MKKHGAHYSVSYTHEYTFPQKKGKISERSWEKTYNTYGATSYGAKLFWNGAELRESSKSISYNYGTIANKTDKTLGIAGVRNEQAHTIKEETYQLHKNADFASTFATTKSANGYVDTNRTVTIPTDISSWTEVSYPTTLVDDIVSRKTITVTKTEWITDYDYSDRVYGLFVNGATQSTILKPEPIYNLSTIYETIADQYRCCPASGVLSDSADWYKVKKVDLTRLRVNYQTEQSSISMIEYMPWNRWCAHAVFTSAGKYGITTYYKKTDEGKTCALQTTHTITYSQHVYTTKNKTVDRETTSYREKISIGSYTEFVTGIDSDDAVFTHYRHWSVEIPNIKTYSSSYTMFSQVGVRHKKSFYNLGQTFGRQFPDPYFERNLTTIRKVLTYTYKEWYLEEDIRTFTYPKVVADGVLRTQEFETKGWFWKTRQANTVTTTAWKQIPSEHKGEGYGTYEADAGYALHHKDMRLSSDESYQIFKKLIWTQDGNVEINIKPYRPPIGDQRNTSSFEANEFGSVSISRITTTDIDYSTNQDISTHRGGGGQGVSVYTGNKFSTFHDTDNTYQNYMYERKRGSIPDATITGFEYIENDAGNLVENLTEEIIKYSYNYQTLIPQYEIHPPTKLYKKAELFRSPLTTETTYNTSYALFGTSYTNEKGFTNAFNPYFIAKSKAGAHPDEARPTPSAVDFDDFNGGWAKNRFNGVSTYRYGPLIAYGRSPTAGRTFYNTYESAISRTVIEHGTAYDDKKDPDLDQYARNLTFDRAFYHQGNHKEVGTRQLGFIDYEEMVYDYKPSAYFGRTYKLKDKTFHRFMRGDAIYLFSESYTRPYVSFRTDTWLGEEITEDGEPTGEYETESKVYSFPRTSTVYETYGSSACGLHHYNTKFSVQFSAYRITTEDLLGNEGTKLAYFTNNKYVMRDESVTDLYYAKSEKTAYVFMTETSSDTGSFIQNAKLLMTSKDAEEIKNTDEDNFITVGSNHMTSDHYDLSLRSDYTKMYWTFLFDVKTKYAKYKNFTKNIKDNKFWTDRVSYYSGAFGMPFSIAGGKDRTFYLSLGTQGDKYQTAIFTEFDKTKEQGSIKGYYEPDWKDVEYNKNTAIVEDDMFLIRKKVPPSTTLHDEYTFKSGCAPYIGTGAISGAGEVIAVKQFKLTVGKNLRQYEAYLPEYSTYEE